MALFKTSDEKEPEKKISWSVPFPPELLGRLRGFSPVLISKKSGIYLDDVFELLKGTRERTSPEVIELLENVLKKLEEDDERLEREATKMNYLIRGFNVLEEKNRKRLLNRLPDDQELHEE